MRHLITLLLICQQLPGALSRRRVRDERGATTVEYVLWTVFAIAIIGVVAAVITGFINGQLAKIGT